MRKFIAATAAVTVLAFTVPASALEGWDRLGTRTVEFRGDQDTISVGRNEGRFHSIMFEVTNGAIEMENVRVVFGSGAAFSPRTKLVFKDGERSRAIDLPGDARLIRSVTFNYRSVHSGEGRAVVTLYGR